LARTFSSHVLASGSGLTNPGSSLPHDAFVILHLSEEGAHVLQVDARPRDWEQLEHRPGDSSGNV
jgi:hypothetical protein